MKAKHQLVKMHAELVETQLLLSEKLNRATLPEHQQAASK